MLFNSLHFAVFLPVVFILYWFVTNKNLKLQNALLLVASYFFYACWDWRFLFLLFFSTVLDFFTGHKIKNATDPFVKRKWFWLSIMVNLGFLGLFKYFNFFADSFAQLLSLGGLKVNAWSLNLILPVGISFYTFHGLSYVIDIYYDRINAEKNVIDYAVFVSFFPLLVAGPIERATHLLPQIKKTRDFDYTKAVDGCRQILWGLFKKIVIADNCAQYANEIFNHSSQYSGSILMLGAIFFSFQIYGDFSGYSDIALGVSKLFGIELLRNFTFPYFSRDIAEFWRRWHISLSSWFKDYLYIPLGGNKGGLLKKIRNTFIIFIVSGVWHGANWTFIFWGALNAMYFLPLLLADKNRINMDVVAYGKIIPSMKEVFQIALTFGLTAFAWIFFRAESLGHAFQYISNLFKYPGSYYCLGIYLNYSSILVLIIIFMIIEWIGREGSFALSSIDKYLNKYFRWIFYFSITLIIYFNGYFSESIEFIYFQF
jgi:alginate O-acetyltransferase complex protein AlgI